MDFGNAWMPGCRFSRNVTATDGDRSRDHEVRQNEITGSKLHHALSSRTPLASQNSLNNHQRVRTTLFLPNHLSALEDPTFTSFAYGNLHTPLFCQTVKPSGRHLHPLPIL